MGLAINMVFAETLVHPETRAIVARKGVLVTAIGLEALVQLGFDSIPMCPINAHNGMTPKNPTECDTWEFFVYTNGEEWRLK